MANLTSGRIYQCSGVNPAYYYFPSLMVNSVGDVAFAFSGSKVGTHIGAYYSWQLANGERRGFPFSFALDGIRTETKDGVITPTQASIPSTA